MSNALLKLSLLKSGKGKCIYLLPNPELGLMYFRDSLSTHNVVHASEVPGKGEMICAQTLFMYLNALRGISTHIEAWGSKIYDQAYLPEGEYAPDLHYRSMVVRLFPSGPTTEFIYRSYLTGSLYKAYTAGQDPYGLGLSPDLPLMWQFPAPVFTPTDKSETDDPRPGETVAAELPDETNVTRKAYIQAQNYLADLGISLIDSKQEAIGGILVDDFFNGDCSRMARTELVHVGKEPPFLDKEIFRGIAIRKWADGPRTPLVFTDHENRMGMAGYHEALELMTDMTLSEFRQNYFR